MTYLVTFLANFFNIFFRAMNQQNVVGGHYLAVFPTSFVLAILEACVYGNLAVGVVSYGILSLATVYLVIALALGGSLGCVSAMYVHRRFIKK